MNDNIALDEINECIEFPLPHSVLVGSSCHHILSRYRLSPFVPRFPTLHQQLCSDIISEFRVKLENEKFRMKLVFFFSPVFFFVFWAGGGAGSVQLQVCLR